MDYTSLNKGSSEQLFLQIRRIILGAIRSQELLPRQRVPSVNELSMNMGVSRMTVRQALQALIQEGWLYTVPGKGTFVAERPHIEQDLQNLKGWTEEIRDQGMLPSTRVISIESIPADRATAKHLNVTAGEQVYRIVRVRYANNFPLAIEKAHLVVNRFHDISGHLRNTQASLYDIMRQVYGVNPIRATQFLEAGEADQDAAELLDLKPGAPVLISERITFGAHNEPLEYVYSIARPGFVRYKTVLTAESSPAWQVMVPDDSQSDHPGESKGASRPMNT
jgi:GntR family transcriptional regulator